MKTVRGAKRFLAIAFLLPPFAEVRAQDHADHAAHEAAAADHATHAPAPTRESDDGSSELEHAPPDPPSTMLPPMGHADMMRMMTMDDSARFARVMLDRFEWRDAKGSAPLAWEAFAWYGGDVDKAWLETEGERGDGETRDARVELLWDHVFARWWSLQTGWRHDLGNGPKRDWLAFGVQGLAPGFFETEATLYAGGNGRMALRLATEYDLRLTQRLVLQPSLDAQVLRRRDAERAYGSGLTHLEAGLRLRYEIRREFAPYAGVVWAHRFGGTADLARLAGEPASEAQWVAGLRAWF